MAIQLIFDINLSMVKLTHQTQIFDSVMIYSPIWKCSKWVGKLNMVYGDPMWNQANFYQGATKDKFIVLF